MMLPSPSELLSSENKSRTKLHAFKAFFISKKPLKTNEVMSIRIRKKVIFSGLIFAQISNFFFLIAEAIPVDEFIIFDVFLILSLFFIILKEYYINIESSSSYIINIVNYTCLLGSLNNFIATLFFLIWGIFFPEKNLAFVENVGINSDFQIFFDFISLVALSFIYKKYRDKMVGIKKEKIIVYELLLIVFLSCTIFIF